MPTTGKPAAAVRFASRALLTANVVVIVVFTIWDAWATWIAFFGGSLPVPGGHLVTGGSLLLGALFVFIVSPILYGLARLVALGLSGLVMAIVSAPAVALSTRAPRPPRTPTRSATPRTRQVTVHFQDGRVTFSRVGAKTQIRAAGFGGAASSETINVAKKAARERLLSQGQTPWF